jgi:hypothetical protein
MLGTKIMAQKHINSLAALSHYAYFAMISCLLEALSKTLGKSTSSRVEMMF